MENTNPADLEANGYEVIVVYGTDDSDTLQSILVDTQGQILLA